MSETNEVTITMSENLAELFAAKAKARLEFKPIVKNRNVKVKMTSGGSYDFDYATLDSVRDSCDEALAKHGLDIFHLPGTTAEGGRVLYTFLSHSSGAYIRAAVVMPGHRDNMKVQEVGSLLTYWERYCYVALAGVASEHDDDGNAADGNTVAAMAPRAQSRRDEPKAAEKPKTGLPEAMGAKLTSKAKELELDREAFTQLIAKATSGKKWAELTPDDADKVYQALSDLGPM